MNVYGPAKLTAQGANRVGASFVDLEREETAGFQQRRGAGEQTACGVESRHAAHERLARLEISHGRVQCVVLGKAHVRWIGDDGAKALCVVHQRRKQVPFTNLDRGL